MRGNYFAASEPAPPPPPPQSKKRSYTPAVIVKIQKCPPRFQLYINK